ncbi:hypothetical protein MRX96_056760 [Rhipicephalus microplus]
MRSIKPEDETRHAVSRVLASGLGICACIRRVGLTGNNLIVPIGEAGSLRVPQDWRQPTMFSRWRKATTQRDSPLTSPPPTP